MPPRWKKLNDKDKWIKRDKLMSDEREKRDPLMMKRLSHLESKNPFRCIKPKSYSFCGSHTTPRVHWYYSKYQQRCLPYNYCENVGDFQMINNENTTIDVRLRNWYPEYK